MQQSEVLILILVIRFCQLPSISLPLQKELSASVRLAKAIGHLALRSLKETYKVYFALALFPCGAHTFIFSVQSAIAAGVAPKCAAARQCVHMIAKLREVKTYLSHWRLPAVISSGAFIFENPFLTSKRSMSKCR